MNLEDAHAELGVEADADAEAVRRAYLRGVKRCKPEVDPEGFRKLREAYEVVTGARAMEHLAKVVERQREHPDAAPVETVVTKEGPVDPTAGRSIAALMEAEDLDEALSVSNARLDFVLANPDLRMSIEGWPMIGLILELHANGRGLRARALTQKLQDYMRQSGLEALVFRGDAAVIWALVRELAALPDTTPDVVQRGFARAVLVGNRKPGLEGIQALRVQDSQAAVNALARMLAEKAPALRATYADVLAEPAAAPASPPTKKSLSFWWVLMVTIVFVRPLLSHIFDDPTPGTTTSYPAGGAPIPTVPAPAPLPAEPVGPVAQAGAMATRANVLGAPAVASAAGALAGTLAAGNCELARERLKTLVDAVHALEPNTKREMQMALTVLRSSIADTCHTSAGDLP